MYHLLYLTYDAEGRTWDYAAGEPAAGGHVVKSGTSAELMRSWRALAPAVPELYPMWGPGEWVVTDGEGRLMWRQPTADEAQAGLEPAA